MWEYIDFIAHFTLGLNILAFSIYCVCVRRVTAFTYVVGMIILLNLFHQWLRFAISGFFHYEDYLYFVNLAWYLSFALTDLAVIYVCLNYIIKKELLRDRASDFVLFCYLFMALLQIVRFFDRIVIETDMLGFVYSKGILLGNAFASIAMLLFAFRAVYIITHSRITLFINR